MTTGALSGTRVLDLSRVLAGPSCTQLLGDLGAEIIKVERPGAGDETRTWGPPYVRDKEGQDTTESAYYLSCNRNKRSITIDISQPQGVALVKRLAAVSDVLVENFKVGGLSRLGLGYSELKEQFPRLIYCSITGFGQTGPYAARPGYDMMAQGMGGLVSMMGEPDRPPVKLPIAINDVMTGLYAAIGILAALRHRDVSGGGQHIDLGLLDVQVGWLFNQGLNYLTAGTIPQRLGTAHPNTVPYQGFATSDGWIILAANNDEQFKRFCIVAEHPELLEDSRYSSNSERVRNRHMLVPIIESILREKPSQHWLDGLERATVPCCPINNLEQVFQDPQVLHREMKISMPYPLSSNGQVSLIGNPIRLSQTAVVYRRPPPLLGEHTEELLNEMLGIQADERNRLRADGII